MMNVTRKADAGELDPNPGLLIPPTTYSQRGVTFWEVSPSESNPAEVGAVSQGTSSLEGTARWKEARTSSLF